ncbi:sugar phosphate nucleotidyltransferase [Thermaurantimonas aggregans]|uniref:sugar phosphate nucleotidyltransferase n=1 Tax=Thermaurantimonas aggregans TaxID=2173829 RepID=UPI0023F100AF|nr:sugar phosphate nucleotidyltransferase [Thermaurantimonas aggregans]MCX8148318.1 sugar phosphate nucleotidyltransferase [Thermaurantimonas aggregans]
MKIIVPMAGRGTRLRPHTLTTPKPLIPIAGKPVVQRLMEDIVKICGQKVEEIAYVIGDFGKEVEKMLVDVAERLGAKGSIYYQDQPLGTAHAILCAAPSLSGPVVIAFADTLFRADFILDSSLDGVIWTKRVENPRQFGVVKKDENGFITEFVEKPEHFVSDEAIIGIYFFKDGEYLKQELQYLIDNDIKDKGEYQLTNAMENMKNKGSKFKTGTVIEWMDCGNKNVVLETNMKILDFVKNEEQLISRDAVFENSTVVEPCFIGAGAKIVNSKIGPYVSIGEGTTVENSELTQTIVGQNTVIKNVNLTNSMIGNKVFFNGNYREVSIGDYSTLE